MRFLIFSPLRVEVEVGTLSSFEVRAY